MSKTTPIEKEPTLNEEQLATLHSQRLDFYHTHLPLVRLQKEYEQSLADIEEARVKRVTFMIRYAQLTSPQEEDPNPEPVDVKEPKKETEPGTRKLKKDE